MDELDDHRLRDLMQKHPQHMSQIGPATQYYLPHIKDIAPTAERILTRVSKVASPGLFVFFLWPLGHFYSFETLISLVLPFPICGDPLLQVKLRLDICWFRFSTSVHTVLACLLSTCPSFCICCLSQEIVSFQTFKANNCKPFNPL